MTEKEKNAYQKYIERLDNRHLLEEVIDSATGDDAKTQFTWTGDVKFQMIKNELYLRLGDWFGTKE